MTTATTHPTRPSHLGRFGSSIVSQGHVPPAAHGFGGSITNPPQRPGLVVAGFVLSWIIPVAGLILCAIGLPEAKRRGAGVTMAYFGIVSSTFWLALALAFAFGLISKPYYW